MPEETMELYQEPMPRNLYCIWEWTLLQLWWSKIWLQGRLWLYSSPGTKTMLPVWNVGCMACMLNYSLLLSDESCYHVTNYPGVSANELSGTWFGVGTYFEYYPICFFKNWKLPEKISKEKFQRYPREWVLGCLSSYLRDGWKEHVV